MQEADGKLQGLPPVAASSGVQVQMRGRFRIPKPGQQHEPSGGQCIMQQAWL